MNKLTIFTASALALALGGCIQTQSQHTQPMHQDHNAHQMQQGDNAQSMQQAPAMNNISGTYQAMLPCASCTGIDTRIVLSTSGNYSYSETYVGQGNELAKAQEGTWEVSGQNVVLKANNNGGLTYLHMQNGSLYLINPADAGSANPSISEQYRFNKQ